MDSSAASTLEFTQWLNTKIYKLSICFKTRQPYRAKFATLKANHFEDWPWNQHLVMFQRGVPFWDTMLYSYAKEKWYAKDYVSLKYNNKDGRKVLLKSEESKFTVRIKFQFGWHHIELSKGLLHLLQKESKIKKWKIESSVSYCNRELC